MSISNSGGERVIERDRFISKKLFRRIIEGTADRFAKSGPMAYTLAIAVLLTGLGEVFGSALSLKWYALVFFLFVIYGLGEYFDRPIEVNRIAAAPEEKK